MFSFHKFLLTTFISLEFLENSDKKKKNKKKLFIPTAPSQNDNYAVTFTLSKIILQKIFYVPKHDANLLRLYSITKNKCPHFIDSKSHLGILIFGLGKHP